MVTEVTVGTINVGGTLGEAAATGGVRKAACVTEGENVRRTLNAPFSISQLHNFNSRSQALPNF